jgi:hypothetical protein
MRWLIFKPNLGAGKPPKSASFIRLMLDEIRWLNARCRRRNE